MGIDSIVVTCDKSVYYAGESITGCLTVVVSSGPVEIDSIELKFEGNADVQWSETKERTVTDSDGQSRTESYTETYTSNQTLICLYRDVPIKGGFLHAGRHTFPFFFDIPANSSNLVSSFEGQHGHVRYSIEATKKPSDDGFFRRLFSRKPRTCVHILQPIDANAPVYKFPVHGEDSKTVCCCCCKSGPLTIDAETDRAAYCPGESIGLTATFENSSNREVKPYVKLIQHQKYYAQGSSNYATQSWDLKPVDDADTEHFIAEGGSCEWNNLQFLLPACYPSLKCEIIDIYYTVEVAMDILLAFNLRVSLPVVMATVAFRCPPPVVTQQQQVFGARFSVPGWTGVGLQASPRIEPTAPPIDASVVYNLLDVPPPSYFETVFAINAARVEQDEASNNFSDSDHNDNDDNSTKKSQ